MQAQGMKMVYEAKNVDSKKMAKSLFTIPDGYEVMSSEELQKAVGGMMMK